MKTNRGFIQILGPILVLIAILGGGYIYYQQNYAKTTPAPITDPAPADNSTENSFDTPKPIGRTYVKPTTPTIPIQPIQPAPISNLPTGWQLYIDNELGFEVSYPSNIFVLDRVNKVLYHKLANAHIYSEKDGSDLGLATDVSLKFGRDITSCQRFVDLKLDSISKPFNYKNISGKVYEMGAEGQGIFTYCVTNGNQNIFTIERPYLASFSTNIANDPTYIPLDQQAKLAEQVLNTFRFLQPNNYQNPNTMPLTLYFYNSANSTDCSATYAVTRTVPKTLAVADASLKALFSENLTKLQPHYLGVSISNSIATVNFKPAAMAYLDGPICMQRSFKTPIEKTLLQFPTIKEVNYSIDGQVVREWSA